MSGFVAIFGRKTTETELRRMLSASHHRGEDFDFAIRNSSAAGIQTFENEDPFLAPAIFRDHELLITFAGCLYRDDSIVGAQDASRYFADLYRKAGTAPLRNQSGSFSAVLIDELANRCIAIRTPPGERPLFYRRVGQALAFASEPKQLTGDPFGKPKPDIEALIDLVSYQLCLLERTPFDGVRRLMAGTQLSFSTQLDEARVERFWDPFSIVGNTRISIDGAIEEFRRLLSLAVKRRLRTGTGVLLSGGLDSTSAAVTAAPIHHERYGLPLPVVSAAYPDHPEVDESVYIKEFAEALSLETNWVYPNPRPFADLDFGAWLHDGVDIGPMSSNFRQILRAAKSSGISSVLDGHDGDAAFGVGIGALHALLGRGQIGVALRHMSFARRRSNAGIARLIRRNLIPALVDFAPAARVAYRRLKGTDDPVPSWAQDLRQSLGDELLHTGWRDAQATVCERHLLIAIEQIERLGAIEGVAVLHPLCDPDLLTFLMGLPPEIRYHTGAPKSLVRSGLPEIPASIRGRTDKTSFNNSAIGGAPTSEVLEETRKSPQLLPGVDWKELESGLESRELVFPERSIVGRVLSADRFLGSQ